MKKRFGKCRLAFILMLVIIMVGSSFTAVFGVDNLPEKPIVLDIYTANDFHASLSDYASVDATNGKVIAKTSAALLAGKINSLRQLNPGGVILLSAGDMLQGSPISNLQKGAPVVDLMNKLKFDAMELGNHEFDFRKSDPNFLQNLAKSVDFPLLAANLYDKNTGKRPDFIKPYTIVERNGVKIGVIGLITMECPAVCLPAEISGLDFHEPIAEVKSLIPEVKAAGADYIILLTHMGATQDKKTGEISGEAALLAKGLDSKDVLGIVSGHSHQTVAGTVNGIAIVQGYYNGRALGHLKITIENGIAKIVPATLDLYNGFASITPDKSIETWLNETIKNDPVFGEVIAYSMVDLKRSATSESNIGNFVSDVLRKKANVDIGFINTGTLRNDVNAGSISLNDIYSILQFDNTIYRMKLTGAQIKEILEQSVTLQKGMMQISGISMKYDTRLEAKAKVTEIKLANGKLINPAGVYSVATNDFIAGGGDFFETFKLGTNKEDTKVIIRDAVLEYVHAMSAKKINLQPVIEGRIVNLDPTAEKVAATVVIPNKVIFNLQDKTAVQNGKELTWSLNVNFPHFTYSLQFYI